MGGRFYLGGPASGRRGGWVPKKQPTGWWAVFAFWANFFVWQLFGPCCWPGRSGNRGGRVARRDALHRIAYIAAS